jgi:hypothetical protein
MLRIREFSFFNLIRKREKPNLPGSLGSSQDISALVDVMLVTMRFVGLSGNAALGKSTKCNLKCVINNREKEIKM